MATENKVHLNGIVQLIRGIKNKHTGELTEIDLFLQVSRRPVIRNDVIERRLDDILVRAKKPEVIRYLQQHNVSEGDALVVTGVLVCESVQKYYFCKSCHKQVFTNASMSYIYPLSVTSSPLCPKIMERVRLTREEVKMNRNAINRIIENRRCTTDPIIKRQFIKPENSDSEEVDVYITTQKVTDRTDASQYLLDAAEGSNEIRLIGDLTREPDYNPSAKIPAGESGPTEQQTKRRSNCTYQIGVNRKVFIVEGNPDIRADFPTIRSIGRQADIDAQVLQKGSSVFIAGALQERDGFTVQRNCPYCGAANEINSSAMEVVPYSVEYLRGCNMDAIKNEEDLGLIGKIDDIDDMDGDQYATNNADGYPENDINNIEDEKEDGLQGDENEDDPEEDEETGLYSDMAFLNLADDGGEG